MSCRSFVQHVLHNQRRTVVGGLATPNPGQRAIFQIRKHHELTYEYLSSTSDLITSLSPAKRVPNHSLHPISFPKLPPLHASCFIESIQASDRSLWASRLTQTKERPKRLHTWWQRSEWWCSNKPTVKPKLHVKLNGYAGEKI